MKSCIALILSIFSLTAQNILGQASTFSLFYRTGEYSGPNASAMVRTPENNYIIAGAIDYSKGLVLKLDAEGQIIWSKQYPYAFNNIAATSDSGFVLAGNNQLFCTRINGAGEVIWAKGIPLVNTYACQSVQQTFDNGYILAGNISYPYGNNTSAFFIAKLNKDGKMEWKKDLYTTADVNLSNSITQTPDSGFLLTGLVYTFSPNHTSAMLVKFSASGEQEWSRKYFPADSSYSSGNDIIPFKHGYLWYVDLGSSVAMMQTDSLGMPLWSRIYETYFSSQDFLSVPPKIRRTSDEGFLLTHGSCFGGSSVIKLDSDFNNQFIQQVSISIVDAIQSSDKGLVIMGNGPTCGVKKGGIGYEVGIVKTDSAGGGNICTNSIFADTIVNAIFITDTCLLSVIVEDSLIDVEPQVADYILEKHAGCVDQGGAVKKNFQNSEISVYPNPVASEIIIESNVFLEFYQLNDLSGKTLVKGVCHTDKLELDLGSLLPGMYILSVMQGGEEMHRKIVKE
jgi:hypothetical protein